MEEKAREFTGKGTVALLPAALCVLFFALSRPLAAESEGLLPDQQRTAILNEIWTVIHTNYYDTNFNGVDWRETGRKYRTAISRATNDYDFHKQLRKMVAELHDSHTHYDLPPDVREPRAKPPAFNVGITLEPTDGGLAVSVVDPKSEAARQGVRIGMIVRSVNGQAAAERLSHLRDVLHETESYSSERVFDYLLRQVFFHGDAGSVARVEFEDEAGNLKSFNLTRKDKLISWNKPPVLIGRRMPSGIGYIGFNHWSPTLKGRFRNELSKLMESSGLIVDVRGNNGGDIDFALEVAGHFFPPGTVLGHSLGRDGATSRWLSRANRPVYRGRVAVLLDAGSLSGSEFFASYMQDSGRAIVVGQQSAGAILKQTGRKITGGGMLHYSTHDFTSIKGRRVERLGITPDRTAKTALSDLRSGRDTALEEAVQCLVDKR